MIQFPVPLYDRQCRPITFERWLELMETPGYQQVAFAEGNGYGVSTVWLWFDQSYGSASVPLIFETMIAGPGGIIDIVRYATEEQALEGHQKVCERYADKLATTQTESGR